MNDSVSAFTKAFIARTRELREARGFTQEEMGTAIGVPPDTYRKYETRSALPLHLLERFSLVVGRDIEYIVTGRQRRPTKAAPQPDAV